MLLSGKFITANGHLALGVRRLNRPPERYPATPHGRIREIAPRPVQSSTRFAWNRRPAIEKPLDWPGPGTNQHLRLRRDASVWADHELRGTGTGGDGNLGTKPMVSGARDRCRVLPYRLL